jgi:predicted flap endonuclease-1-like 5' DNA nuclease
MLRTVLGSLAGLAVALAGAGFFVWLLWWLWSRHEKEKVAPIVELKTDLPSPAVEEEGEEQAPVADAEIAEEAPAEPKEAEEAPVETKASKPDDLTRIEGIGPKIASVLQGAGITTFAQLADATPEDLAEILEAADPRLRRLANPTTWPEQAALTAAGEWEAHEALRSELKGGRRV